MLVLPCWCPVYNLRNAANWLIELLTLSLQQEAAAASPSPEHSHSTPASPAHRGPHGKAARLSRHILGAAPPRGREKERSNTDINTEVSVIMDTEGKGCIEGTTGLRVTESREKDG